MASMAEKKLTSVQTEVEKLQIRIQKMQDKIQKNQTKCEKLGCADWTEDEWKAKRKVLCDKSKETGSMWIQFEDGFLSQKQDDVLWNKFIEYNHQLQDLQNSLEHAVKRLDKAVLAFEGIQAELAEQEEVNQREESWLNFWKALTPEQIEKNRQEAERRYQEWLKQFKEDCLKDGVIISEATNSCITGFTKSKKKFCMLLNNGWSIRSFHCYTLYIDGQTVFTSGLFSTGYSIVKR